MIYSTSARVGGPVETAGPQHRLPRALLAVGGKRLLVPPGGATIGRSRDCEIVIDDSGVSRRHAQLRPGAGRWEIEDLGSTNGVLVNGRVIEGAQELEPGDRLELGTTEALFELG
jgi:predicted component of type VI protein secretion system